MGLASTVLDAESCVYRMQNATEGTIKETTYWWPRPSEDEPFESETFYTKVGDQICAVGYYKK